MNRVLYKCASTSINPLLCYSLIIYAHKTKHDCLLCKSRHQSIYIHHQKREPQLNSDKIRKDLGWTDKVSLEQGIGQTIDWVDANLAALQTLPQSYVHKA
jgi:dTDP-D-glucose 4,6-dehydratase